MNYKIQHITNDRKIIRDMDNPEFITIHSTANPDSTAQNERDNLNRRGNTSSTGFHIVVDDKQAIECIPLNKVAFHAGDGRFGTGNSKSIGIEMCESGNREKTIENTIQLVAKMLNDRDWDVDRLKRHYDWSGKNCPRILSTNNWQGWNLFKQKVSAHLRGMNNKNSIRDYSINGKDYKYDSINIDGTIYAPVRDLAKNLGFNVSNKGSKALFNTIPTNVLYNNENINVDMVKVNNDTNYIKLRDLEKLGLAKIDWVNGVVVIKGVNYD